MNVNGKHNSLFSICSSYYWIFFTYPSFWLCIHSNMKYYRNKYYYYYFHSRNHFCEIPIQWDQIYLMLPHLQDYSKKQLLNMDCFVFATDWKQRYSREKFSNITSNFIFTLFFHTSYKVAPNEVNVNTRPGRDPAPPPNRNHPSFPRSSQPSKRFLTRRKFLRAASLISLNNPFY